MQQLYQLIKERCQNISEVTQQNLSSQRVKSLKQQQKSRCQKQNFVISMMRANSKSIQIISKNTYYKFSYEIMKKINPEFQHEYYTSRLQQNFLNDFVGLYKSFFSKYEDIFNFKIKLQNLIRPTNHSLTIDLVKYLVDFSRDYYQQTFIWYMKSLNKTVKTADNDRYVQPIKEDNIEQKIKEGLEQISEQTKSSIHLKRSTRNSLTQAGIQRAIMKKNQALQPKEDPIKNYDILDIAGWPTLMNHAKQFSTNTQVLKIRMNDIFRQMKSRNTAIKSIFNNYCKSFVQKQQYKIKQSIQIEDDSLNRLTHPFRLSLFIEKNGFNCINVVYCESKYYSKLKDKKLQPLKNSQRLFPISQNKISSEYLLTSLKIIRFSQNFLPPIINTVNKQLYSSKNSVNIPLIPIIQANTRLNLVSSNSAGNYIEENEQKIKQKHIIYNPQPKNHHIINMNTESSTQPENHKIVKEKSYRKLSEIKRNFRSEQKRQGGILTSPLINPTLNINDPQKKIYDWLQKLRQIKQIERKKIMGL